jgi:hypothetical protein
LDSLEENWVLWLKTSRLYQLGNDAPQDSEKRRSGSIPTFTGIDASQFYVTGVSLRHIITIHKPHEASIFNKNLFFSDFAEIKHLFDFFFLHDDYWIRMRSRSDDFDDDRRRRPRLGTQRELPCGHMVDG